MELEVEMESRLREFRSRKETEVTDQLERQLSKREEIMRNKALIEVRRRESEIRAEIEAQLSVKRAEIRERLATLDQRSEEFKQVAEEKIRTQLERNLVSDEDMEDEVRLKQLEDEAENLEKQDTVLDRRQRWMGALEGAQGQMPETAVRPGGLVGGGRLGQPKSSTSPELGGQAPTPAAGLPGAGGKLAPSRSPIGQTSAPTTPSLTTTIPRPTAGSTMAERLAPVRAPIRVEGEPTKPARSLSDIAEDVGSPAPPSETKKPEEPSGMFSIGAPTDDDWDEDEELDISKAISGLTTLKESEPVTEEATPVSRAPPGGGRLVQEDVDEEQSAEPTTARGPPGGGKLVRERIAPSERSRIRDSGDLPVDILKPVRRPVLQPKSSETTNIKSTTTTVKVMIPLESPEVAKLTPVKTTLTPLPSSEEE
jgi:hypothetical protein